MEKDSWFTAMVLQHVVRHCFEIGLLKQKDTVCFWSDGGPHYRSVVSLSNHGFWTPQRFKVSAATRFGCEHHMKGEVDATFGSISRRVRHAAYKKIIRTAEEMVDVCRSTAPANDQHETYVPEFDKATWKT